MNESGSRGRKPMIQLAESSEPEGAAFAEPSSTSVGLSPSDRPGAALEGIAKAIVDFRSGLGLDRPQTLGETAEHFGLQRVDVRRIEAESLFKPDVD